MKGKTFVSNVWIDKGSDKGVGEHQLPFDHPRNDKLSSSTNKSLDNMSSTTFSDIKDVIATDKDLTKLSFALAIDYFFGVSELS